MPRVNRPRRERTHDWQKIKQYTLWPEQQLYEKLRTVVLFNESAAERARETGTAERTLQRQAERFEERGMISLFPKEPVLPSKDARELPPDMRQLIVDLKAEHPAFRPHEIATVCYVRFGRRPSHQYVISVEERDSMNSLGWLLAYSILRCTKRSMQHGQKPTSISYCSTPGRLGKPLSPHRR